MNDAGAEDLIKWRHQSGIKKMPAACKWEDRNCASGHDDYNGSHLSVRVVPAHCRRRRSYDHWAGQSLPSGNAGDEQQ